MPTIVDLNPVPNRATRPDTIDDDSDQFFGKLPSWGDMMLAMYSGTLAASAGGVYAIPYAYDSNITNADPGAGKLRFNAATQSAATSLYLDLVNTAGADVSGLLDQMDASSSVVKGKLRLVKANDPLKWLTFDLTGRTSLTGYRGLTVTGAIGSAANPFANGDLLLMFFERTGDKGDFGSTTYMKVSDRKSANTVGGAVTASPITRALNTVEWNDILGASLASNQVTLPAGTYEVHIRAPAWSSGTHQARLQNITDGTATLLGSNSGAGGASSSTMTDSVVTGRFTITSPKVFSVYHYVNVTTGSTLGNVVGTGSNEIYTEAIFKRVS